MSKRNFRIISIAVISIALLMGMNSCGPKNGLVGDPVKGMAIEYTMKEGQVLSYQAITNTNTNMEQMGQTFDIINNSDMTFTLTGKGTTEEGNISADFKIDDFTIDMEGPGLQAPDVSPTVGHVMSFVFSPRGKKIELLDKDSLTVNVGQMGGGEQPLTALIQGVLARMPDGIRKIGDTWEEAKQDTTQRQGMDVITDTETKYTLESVENLNGYECLKLVAEMTGTMDGSGETQGMSLTLEGDLETNTVVYFAFREQLMVKQEIKTFTEATVAISGPMEMTMPTVSESTTVVELKK